MFHARAPLLLEWLPPAQTEMTLGSGFSRDSDEIVLHLATCVYTVWRAWWPSCSGAAAGCCRRQLWVSCWHHELSVLVKRWWQKVACSGIRVPAPGSELAACHQSPRLRFQWTLERFACGLCLHQLNCSCVYGPAPGSLLCPREEETRTISPNTISNPVRPHSTSSVWQELLFTHYIASISSLPMQNLKVCPTSPAEKHMLQKTPAQSQPAKVPDAVNPIFLQGKPMALVQLTGAGTSDQHIPQALSSPCARPEKKRMAGKQSSWDSKFQQAAPHRLI